ncbi:restriction endonuclease [Lysobacter sp. cf310]|uniref:restriction endonuclease n=1 Tax=Lysobacter sp. cf310 TaxID=1761790 RepID=UPI0008E17CE5|nr:restriction endonuclease [Lysobacter sp. cf310]SFK68718.1 Restriction endonuclease [Lysobacter sp. cf310]
MSGLKPVTQRYSDALSRLRWDQFEALLAAYYRGQGYLVDHVGTGATGARFDGGIDLKLRRDDAYLLVQCKHWNANQVTHNAVHELLGLMINEGATGAILISSGEFTRAARDAAMRQGHVQLIDGVALRPMLAPLLEAATLLSTQAGASSPDSAGGWGDDPVAALSGPPSPRTPLRVRSGSVPRQSNAGWWIVAVVGTLVFVLLVRLLLGRTEWSAGPSVEPSERQSEASAPAEPIAESEPVVIEWPAEQGAPPVEAPKPQTEAELRESQRKADEAMKVIEATTPEM